MKERARIQNFIIGDTKRTMTPGATI